MGEGWGAGAALAAAAEGAGGLRAALRAFVPEPTSNYFISILLFLQIAVILFTCRLVGRIGKWFGQPQVVCEMIAGVLLGPSLLGLAWPAAEAALFPKESLTVIYGLAQIALALYMFCVGLEFDVGLIRARLRGAASVSLAGIAVPFALGAGIALAAPSEAGLFSESATPGEAALFMGAAMSITAFPMLARIISERRLSGTALGTLALAAGSCDDAAAWCVLAVVLASFQDEWTIALFAIGGGLAYAALCWTVVRRGLVPLARRVERQGRLTPGKFTLMIVLLMSGAYFTDAIGIYAVFGAFIVGTATPRGRMADELRVRIEPLTTALLLPMFFVYSGLNTRIFLVNTPTLWLIALGALAAACVGKGVACALAARLHGESARDCVALGALMNARGLMELIILNIGLERGVITPTLFSIMVIMAIVTTLMATPIFSLALGRDYSRRGLSARGAPGASLRGDAGGRADSARDKGGA